MVQKNYLLSALSGLILALAWPTYGMPLLAFFGFIPMLISEKNIRKSNTKHKTLHVFLSSYLGLVIWNSITTWWIWYSTPFGMAFAILVNALLMAILWVIYHKIAPRVGQKTGLVFLATLWISFEKFHLNWDFSWPWLNLGNVFSSHTHWIQWYCYTGSFGGSLWVWILTIFGFLALTQYQDSKNKKTALRHGAVLVLGITLPIVISVLILENYQLATKKATVMVLQPNVDPYTEKFNQNNIQSAYTLTELLKTDIKPQTSFIIAPETTLAQGVSFQSFQYSSAKDILQKSIAKYPKASILSGIDLYALYYQKEKPNPQANSTRIGQWYNLYNAGVLINHQKQLPPFYIKSKLVVGVENFPFKNILEPLLGDIMIDLGGTASTRTTQKERMVFYSEDKKAVAAPVICYESIYGEYVTDYVKKGANFLAIMTNDAWWDNTQGHKQHLSYAALRAIETRRSVARSANTGISAFINEKGEITHTLGYNQKGSLQQEIRLNQKITFYTRYGDYIARLALIISVFIFFFACFKPIRKK